MQRTDYWCDSSRLAVDGSIRCYNAPCDSFPHGSQSERLCYVREYLTTRNRFGDTIQNPTLSQYWDSLRGLPSLAVVVILLLLVARRARRSSGS